MNTSAIYSAIINIIYPVGSIIQNYNDSTNPGEKIPGTTWEKLEDRFLVNAGNSPNNSTTFTLGDSGGEKDVILTSDNLPEHTHVIEYGKYQGGADPNKNIFDWISSEKHTQSVFGKASEDQFTELTKIGTYSTSTGGTSNTQAHNNMPPYMKVYGWYRIS